MLVAAGQGVVNYLASVGTSLVDLTVGVGNGIANCFMKLLGQ